MLRIAHQDHIPTQWANRLSVKRIARSTKRICRLKEDDSGGEKNGYKSCQQHQKPTDTRTTTIPWTSIWTRRLYVVGSGPCQLPHRFSTWTRGNSRLTFPAIFHANLKPAFKMSMWDGFRYNPCTVWTVNVVGLWMPAMTTFETWSTGYCRKCVQMSKRSHACKKLSTNSPTKKSANTDNDARLDIRARRFWRPGLNVFFDVRVTTNADSKSQRNSKLETVLRKHEEEKNTQYNKRVMEIKHGSFNPLVFTTSGCHECTKFYKALAEKLSIKKGERCVIFTQFFK